MTKRSSSNAVSGKTDRTIAVLLCATILFAFGAAAASLSTLAQEKGVEAPGPLEVRLFKGADFSGQMLSVMLEAGKSYAYIQRFSEGDAPVVRSVQAGSQVAVALFRHPHFSAQDASCAPTLGSDAQPDLIWTGQTADFLPSKTRSQAMAKLTDGGEDGYASAIVYRRSAGPPPGALLMKRRRSYGRGCGNILRSFNFDRRFFPLELAPETANAGTPSGCFNLKGTATDKGALTDMLRSDRIVMLQPSDLDRRYAGQERRFQAMLFDGENCKGESVTLQAPFRSGSSAATAADSGERRDILLSSLLFRDRTQSLRIEALDRPGGLVAKKIEPKISEPAPVKAPASPIASKPAPDKAPKAVAPSPASVAPVSVVKAPDPEPKILPQSATTSNAAPKAALPAAKLDPMEKLPVGAAGQVTPAQTAQPQHTAPSAAAAQNRPETTPEKSLTPTETPQSRTQLSQSQAQPQNDVPEPAENDTGTEVFAFPVYDVYRLNFCLSTKGQCGEPAANKWCQMKGFTRAVGWRKDNNIGGLFPTFLMGDEQICAQYKCDGFAEITCGR